MAVQTNALSIRESFRKLRAIFSFTLRVPLWYNQAPICWSRNLGAETLLGQLHKCSTERAIMSTGTRVRRAGEKTEEDLEHSSCAASRDQITFVTQDWKSEPTNALSIRESFRKLRAIFSFTLRVPLWYNQAPICWSRNLGAETLLGRLVSARCPHQVEAQSPLT